MRDLALTERLDEGNRRHLRLLRSVALIFLVMLVVAGNVILFRQIDVQLERSYTAESDNTIWNLSQIEVELLQFEAALSALRLSPGDRQALDRVRLRFDLLYSRVELASQTRRTRNSLLIQSEDWANLTGPDGLMARALVLIDGPDDALIAQAPLLGDLTADVTAALRDEIVATTLDSIERSEGQRHELQSSLQLFSAVALGLMGVMAGMTIVIYLQGRARERHRQELAQAVYNLRITIDSSLEAAVILDHAGRVIGCNRAGAEMFDYREGGDVSRYLSDVLRDVQRGARGIESGEAACQSGGARGRITMTGTRRDGNSFPLEISLAQAQSAAGKPIAIAFLRDISRRVERERVLSEARDAALKGEEAKSRFLAVISHEMRTPLNGLLSAVELLATAAPLNERQTWLARVIENCGRATLEQVNNVLDLTSLNSGDAVMATADVFSPRELMEEILAKFEPEARQRGNSIGLTITGNLPDQLRGRSDLLRRAMTNLVSNAVKFTENGRVTLSLDAQPARSEGQVALRISVADTGVGIADADLHRIFRIFETLDSSYSRLRQGSGLGLGLAKLAAEAMGGRITVTSRKGEGSTFSIFLNLAVSSGPVAVAAKDNSPAVDFQAWASETDLNLAPQAEPAGQPLRLLLVEDNPVNRELLAELLSLRGHTVIEAANGAEGVERANNEDLDAILMDISMPVMDGMEASRRIRAGGRSARVPIIAVTANADSHPAEEFKACGISEVLGKPVDIRQIEAALRRQILPVEHRPAAPANQPQPVIAAAAVASPPSAPRKAGRGGRPAIKPAPKNKPAPKEVQLRRVTPSPGEEAPPRDDAGDPRRGAAALLDEEVLADLTESLGPVYIGRLAERFVNETEAALASLTRHEAEGDLAAAAQVAHKNAGAAASLGLRAMHGVLVSYERAAKAGDHAEAKASKGRIEEVKYETFSLLRQRGITA